MRRSKLLWLFVGTAGLAIATALWVVAHRETHPPPGPSAADVYADMAAALSRLGMIAHVTFDSADPDSGWISSRREAWPDVAGDVARERTTTTYRSPSVSTTRESGVVYRAGAAYYVGEDGQPSKGPVEGCANAPARVLSVLASCPRSPGTIKTRTESRQRFDGVDALVVVTEGKLSGIDSVVEIRNRLFIDTVSHLPLAFENRGTDRYALGGYENDFQRVTRFTIDFVARDSLPPDFFDPSAIGYTELGPQQAIDAAGAAFPIFWLGAKRPASDTEPPIALSDVRVVGSDQPELGPTVQLTYSRADDEFAQLLTLSEMSAVHAEFLATTGGAADWRRDACAKRTEIPVTGARAVVFEWHMNDLAVDAEHCPASAPDGVVLELDSGDTFVTVLPSPARTGAGLANPYASVEALRSLATKIEKRTDFEPLGGGQ